MNQQLQPIADSNTPNTLSTAYVLTDTAKIVRRHLQNKDDVITEEDLLNVRIITDLPPAVASKK